MVLEVVLQKHTEVNTIFTAHRHNIPLFLWSIVYITVIIRSLD